MRRGGCSRSRGNYKITTRPQQPPPPWRMARLRRDPRRGATPEESRSGCCRGNFSHLNKWIFHALEGFISHGPIRGKFSYFSKDTTSPTETVLLFVIFELTARWQKNSKPEMLLAPTHSSQFKVSRRFFPCRSRFVCCAGVSAGTHKTRSCTCSSTSP
jgi:hypothetical protein